ncbi:MAG: peptide-methionine (R)-S-oxide reductase MsrB [Thermoanaerobaculia bacterium]
MRNAVLAVFALALAGLLAGCPSGVAHSTESGAPLMLDPAALAQLAQTNDAWKLSPDDPSVQVDKSDAEWKKVLSEQQYYVLRKGGTEHAWSCALLNVHQPGFFRCAGCGLRIFRSGQKFESGSGWPSFWQPISADRILTKRDMSWGMMRTEVLCPRCGGHLGHVFEDGPPPTGLRYCMNGVAMAFEPAPEEPAVAKP